MPKLSRSRVQLTTSNHAKAASDGNSARLPTSQATNAQAPATSLDTRRTEHTIAGIAPKPSNIPLFEPKLVSPTRGRTRFANLGALFSRLDEGDKSDEYADNDIWLAKPSKAGVARPKQQLWLQTRNATVWNRVLSQLQEEDPTRFKELEDTRSGVLDSRKRTTDDFFDIDMTRPESKAIVQRCKQYLPSLAAIRGIVMTAAALDPHKVAPIVCASIFFSIDVSRTHRLGSLAKMDSLHLTALRRS